MRIETWPIKYHLSWLTFSVFLAGIAFSWISTVIRQDLPEYILLTTLTFLFAQAFFVIWAVLKLRSMIDWRASQADLIIKKLGGQDAIDELLQKEATKLDGVFKEQKRILHGKAKRGAKEVETFPRDFVTSSKKAFWDIRYAARMVGAMVYGSSYTDYLPDAFAKHLKKRARETAESKRGDALWNRVARQSSGRRY